MKSFRQYITEKKDDIVTRDRYSSGSNIIRGLVNPSYDEIRGFLNRSRDKVCRWVLYKDQMLVWDAMDAIHGDVIDGEYGFGENEYKVRQDRDSAYGYVEYQKFPMNIVKMLFTVGYQKDGLANRLKAHKRMSHILSSKDVMLRIGA